MMSNSLGGGSTIGIQSTFCNPVNKYNTSGGLKKIQLGLLQSELTVWAHQERRSYRETNLGPPCSEKLYKQANHRRPEDWKRKLAGRDFCLQENEFTGKRMVPSTSARGNLVVPSFVGNRDDFPRLVGRYVCAVRHSMNALRENSSNRSGNIVGTRGWDSCGNDAEHPQQKAERQPEGIHGFQNTAGTADRAEHSKWRV